MNLRVYSVLMLTAMLLGTSMIAGPTGLGAGAAAPGTRNGVPTNNVTRVNVNLTYPNGSQAPNCWVVVRNMMDGSALQVSNVTDEKGLITLNITSLTWGPCLIYAEDTVLYYYTSVQRFIGPDEVIDLHLQLSEYLPSVNTVTGMVTNASSGAPVPGAQIVALGTDLSKKQIVMVNISDAEGRYTLHVPDSDSEYRLTGPEWYDPEFEVAQVYFFLQEGVTDYDIDIPLLPKYEETYPVSFRMFNSTTGKYVSSGGLSVNGYDSSRDDIERYGIPFASSPSPEGYANGSLPTGYYSLNWGLYIPDQRLSYSAKMFFLVNKTGMTMDLSYEVPNDFRPVTLTVKDGADPVTDVDIYAYFDLSAKNTDVYTHSSVTTDTEGKAMFGLPIGSEAMLEFTKKGYRERDILIPATMDNSPLDLTVGLVKAPMADLSILVKDGLTGTVLPGSDCRLYDSNGNYYGEYNTDHNGYLNISVEAQVYRSIEVASPIGRALLENVPVLGDPVTEIVIAVERYSMPGTKYPGWLTLKDAQGAPVPGQGLIVRCTDPGLGLSFRSTTGSDGVARFYLEPGNYSASIEYYTPTVGYWRSLWATPAVLFVFPIGGGEAPDLIAYQSYPFVNVEGFVRDSVTNKTIPTATLSTSIRYYLGDQESVYLASISSGSTPTGYYRFRGRDTADLYAEKDGYFPRSVTIDIGQTEDKVFDIYLDPIPERTIWVNGTIVGEGDEPIPGHIMIYDIDNDGPLGWVNTGDGAFSLHLYRGNFTIGYYDDPYKYSDSIKLFVNTTDIEGLILKIVPREGISGSVSASNGTPVASAWIKADCLSGYKAGETFSTYTDNDGFYQIYNIYSGTYKISVDAGPLYDVIEGAPFDFDGRSPLTFDFVLLNRSYSNLYGYVNGYLGPFPNGIPNATLMLKDDLGATVDEVISGENGYFEVLKVPFGTNFSLEVSPPDDYKFINGTRSGYLGVTLTGINLTQASEYIYPYLEYRVIPGDEPLQIWSSYPTGTEVYTIAPITMTFSTPVEVPTFSTAFSISPVILDAVYEWSTDNI
ncbi:MAG: hypothetical protein LUQ69_09845, partial [Methanoregulaceae archaeon]|nr:hypothetical protein [Methanoregulaceae archaeon]